MKGKYKRKVISSAIRISRTQKIIIKVNILQDIRYDSAHRMDWPRYAGIGTDGLPTSWIKHLMMTST